MKTFRMDGVIGWDITARDFSQFLDSAGGDDVKITINSLGGYIPEGWSMVNAAREYSGKMHFQIDHAASMGACIAMTPGAYVTMYRGTSVMMIHRAWSVAFGNPDDIESQSKNLRKMENMIVQNFLDRADGKLDENELRDMLQAETYLDAQEAKDYGLIDKVLTTSAEASNVVNIGGTNINLHKFAAAALHNTSLRDDIEESSTIRDVQGVLRNAGRLSKRDSDTLVAKIKSLQLGDPPAGGQPGNTGDPEPDDLIALGERIRAISSNLKGV